MMPRTAALVSRVLANRDLLFFGTGPIGPGAKIPSMAQQQTSQLSASPPMFESRILDFFTRVHPIMPAVVFLPVVAGGIWLGIDRGLGGGQIPEGRERHSRQQRSGLPPVFSDARGAHGAGGAPVEPARHGHHVGPSRMAARHLERVLVRLRAAVREERPAEVARRHLGQQPGKLRPLVVAHRRTDRAQPVGLLLDRLDHSRVLMPDVDVDELAGEVEPAVSGFVPEPRAGRTGDDDGIDASGNNYGVLIHGGAGDDIICGSAYDDDIYGDEGSDMIYGLGGNDVIYAQDSGGADWVSGGEGYDVFYGNMSDIIGDSSVEVIYRT